MILAVVRNLPVAIAVGKLHVRCVVLHLLLVVARSTGFQTKPFRPALNPTHPLPCSSIGLATPPSLPGRPPSAVRTPAVSHASLVPGRIRVPLPIPQIRGGDSLRSASRTPEDRWHPAPRSRMPIFSRSLRTEFCRHEVVRCPLDKRRMFPGIRSSGPPPPPGRW